MSAQRTAHSGQRTADSAELERKRQRVQEQLEGFERVIVAFSGGVDSTLLLKLARDVVGKEGVLAVTADSASLARNALADTARLARELDVEHRIVKTREVDDPRYQANTSSRCYLCKQTLFEELEVLARAQRYDAVLYGAIGDDVASERPGQRAAAERNVRAPLQEAGLSKAEVRALARELGLSNWDRPQDACLSSRIPHGLEVTREKLEQIEAAEAFLRVEGFRQVRVRHLGARARIEVEPEAVGRFRGARLRAATAEVFARLGFSSVGVRRDGYLSGGANQERVDEEFL